LRTIARRDLRRSRLTQSSTYRWARVHREGSLHDLRRIRFERVGRAPAATVKGWIRYLASRTTLPPWDWVVQ
jgi:hypothetical protein